MMTTAAASGGSGFLPRRAFFRSSSLLLLGLAFLSVYGAAGDEELANTIVRPHGYIRKGTGNGNIGLLAKDNLANALRDEHDADAMEPLAGLPGGDSVGSSPVAVQSRREELELTQGEVTGRLNTRLGTVKYQRSAAAVRVGS